MIVTITNNSNGRTARIKGNSSKSNNILINKQQFKTCRCKLFYISDENYPNKWFSSELWNCTVKDKEGNIYTVTYFPE